MRGRLCRLEIEKLLDCQTGCAARRRKPFAKAFPLKNINLSVLPPI
jgi:hypothetical protein